MIAPAGRGLEPLHPAPPDAEPVSGAVESTPIHPLLARRRRLATPGAAVPRAPGGANR